MRPKCHPRLLTGVLALLLAVPCLAAPQSPATVAPADLCTVDGTVIRASDGQPIRRARVTLRGMQEPREAAVSVNSAADGRFVFRDMAPGRYALIVERNGFIRQNYNNRSGSPYSANLALERGGKVRGIVFRLVAAGAITGHVYDEEGDPAAWVSMQALRYTYVRGRRQLLASSSAQSNDLGEYRLFGLQPGRYYLIAVVGGEFGNRRTRIVASTDESRAEIVGSTPYEEVYAPTYYPGASDPARAVPLDVDAGAELRGMDFTIVPQRAVRVRGRVLSGAGSQLLRGAQVILIPRDVSGLFGLRSASLGAPVEDAQGNFEIRGVPPGSYILQAVLVEEGRPHSARESIEVGSSDVEGFVLTVQPGMELSGRVRTEGKAAMKLTEVAVFLQPRSDAMTGGGVGTVATDGTFQVRNLQSDAYRLTVFNLPADTYLKDARLDQQSVLDEGFTLTRGRAPGLLEITLSANGGSVEGNVNGDDGQPAAGATVALVPAPQRRNNSQWFKSALTDERGHFLLRDIAPGEYKLFSWETVEEDAWQDPLFLGPYEDRGEKIQVAESARLSVALKILRAK